MKYGEAPAATVQDTTRQPRGALEAFLGRAGGYGSVYLHYLSSPPQIPRIPVVGLNTN